MYILITYVELKAFNIIDKKKCFILSNIKIFYIIFYLYRYNNRLINLKCQLSYPKKCTCDNSSSNCTEIVMNYMYLCFCRFSFFFFYHIYLKFLFLEKYHFFLNVSNVLSRNELSWKKSLKLTLIFWTKICINENYNITIFITMLS